MVYKAVDLHGLHSQTGRGKNPVLVLPGERVLRGEGLRLSLSPSLLAELLPHLGGLQLEGHQAALPAQVSGGGTGRGMPSSRWTHPGVPGAR